MTRELSLPALFQLGYYWETKILLTSVKIDIYTKLSDGGKTAEEAAGLLGSDVRATELLLNALVTLGALNKEGNRYTNTPVGQEFLVKGSPHYAGHLLVLQNDEWEYWGKLEETVKTGRSPVKGNIFLNNPEVAENVTMVLHRMAVQRAPALAKLLDLSDCRTLLDLGGGAGTHSIFLCKAHPHLHATVFDLPETLSTTHRIIHEFGMADRIDIIAGDFYRDEITGPYDAVFMSDVIHYQDPGGNISLMKKVYQCLREGGKVIIKDMFLNEDKISPGWTVAFSVHLLVYTEKGRCYTVREVHEWLEKEGFVDIKEIERASVIMARKPGSLGGGKSV